MRSFRANRNWLAVSAVRPDLEMTLKTVLLSPSPFEPVAEPVEKRRQLSGIDVIEDKQSRTGPLRGIDIVHIRVQGGLNGYIAEGRAAYAEDDEVFAIARYVVDEFFDAVGDVGAKRQVSVGRFPGLFLVVEP